MKHSLNIIGQVTLHRRAHGTDFDESPGHPRHMVVDFSLRVFKEWNSIGLCCSPFKSDVKSHL